MNADIFPGFWVAAARVPPREIPPLPATLQQGDWVLVYDEEPYDLYSVKPTWRKGVVVKIDGLSLYVHVTGGNKAL